MLNPQKIWSSTHLPTLPTVAKQLLELVRDPEATINAVVEVIKADPATAAKLVKAANASYFGLRSEVKSVDRAVALLGTTVSVSMTLSFVLSDDSMKSGPIGVQYRTYWQQSIFEAVTAEHIARHLPGEDPGEFFMMGLMLSIGRLAMLKTVGDIYLPVLEAAHHERRLLRDVEQRELGVDHVAIGAQLMRNWKLPADLIDAIEKQGLPVDELVAQRGTSKFASWLTAALSTAVGYYFCSTAKGYALDRLQQLFSLLPLLKPDRVADLETLLADCESRSHEAARLFDVDLSDIGSSTDMMVEANEQLLQLTLREHASNAQSQIQTAALVEERSRLKQENQALQAQAMYDGLTGLYNRKYFDEALQRDSNRAQRQSTPLGVIFADVDRFKSLNDTYGHAIGDFVLKEIAQRFRETIRATDIVARYGGEELVVLVYQPTEKGVETLANRIRERIADEPFLYDQLRLEVTCSLGAAVAIPDRGAHDIGRQLVAAADEAMYAAKHGGRNRVALKTLLSDLERTFQQKILSSRFSRWLVQQRVLDITQVSKALLECPPQTLKIGELALAHQLLTESQVMQILETQEQFCQRFGEIAAKLGYLSTEQVAQLLAWQQEPPKKLVESIVRSGLLAPALAAAAYDRYMQSCTVFLQGNLAVSK